MSRGKAQRVKEYLDKHQIGSLFEEMMGKLIVEQPADPLQYISVMIEQRMSTTSNKGENLSKTTGNINLGATSRDVKVVRTSVNAKDLNRNKKLTDSPQKTSTKDVSDKNATAAEVTVTGAAGTNMLESFVKPSAGGDSKYPSADWLKLAAYQNFFRKTMKDDDLLMDEVPSSLRKQKIKDSQEDDASGMPSIAATMLAATAGKKILKNLKDDKKKHRADLLEFLLNESEKRSADDNDSGYHDNHRELQYDEAPELWEDLDLLKSEGVQISKSNTGNKNQVVRKPMNVVATAALGTAAIQSAAAAPYEVKVSICARCARIMEEGFDDAASDRTLRDSNAGSSRPESRASRSSRAESVRSDLIEYDNHDYDDEEFESVSQVTGPRRPVWTEEAHKEEKITSSLPNMARAVTPVLRGTESLDIKSRPIASPARRGSGSVVAEALFSSVDKSLGERPPSKQSGARPPSRQGAERPSSRHGNRPPAGDRPPSRHGEDRPLSLQGGDRPSSRHGSRTSSHHGGDRPSSRNGDRPPSRQSVDKSLTRMSAARRDSKHSLEELEVSAALRGSGWNVVDAVDSDDSSTAYVTGAGQSARKSYKSRVY